MPERSPAAGEDADAPLDWHDVLVAESRHIDPAFTTPPPDSGDAAPADRLTRLNQAILAEHRTALCLSGGGIRSASFAIGVLQGLATRGLVPGFDYLSTVSGGGFAGGWLSAWRHRAGSDAGAAGSAGKGEAMARDSWNAFAGQADASSKVEPWPVERIRSYTRYLSPESGFFSADFWGLIATVIRNLLLNWAVLLPLLAAAMLVPRVQYALIHMIELPNPAAGLGRARDLWSLIIAAAAYLVALAFIVLNLPSYGGRKGTQPQFLVWCLLPISIGALALMYYWAMYTEVYVGPLPFATASGVLHALAWGITSLATGARSLRPRTMMAAFLAGFSGAIAYYGMFSGLFNYDDLGQVYVSLAFPLVMGVLVVQAVLFVGLAGREMSGSDLEWWSRAAAWILIVAATWLIFCAIGFGVPAVFHWALIRSRVAVGSLGGLTAALGGVTSWLLRPSAEPAKPSVLRRIALALAAPAFVVLIAGAAATVDDQLVVTLAHAGAPGHFLAPIQAWPICADAEQEARYSLFHCHPADSGFAETVLLLLGLLGLGLFTSRLVPANKFSLHDMYKHRLTRAYLGASRYQRHPNPFTGFDPDDDLALAAIAGQRPLHVINTTLNTRVDLSMGRQQRRALSFTFSPLHAGASTRSVGYRPVDRFAFNPLSGQGITLGAAVTISGAAASPQMGEFTTGSMAFLLALFNARLGVWLGNPGYRGDAWQARDPRAGVGPILREMLGWTTDRNPYIFLSDGGHFDNLGLWEMVLRRCRHIVIVDAGCDPEYRFEDLANAVRLARIDHGAEIRFDSAAMNALRSGDSKPHVVTGSIRYPEAAADEEPGTIVYIKPALQGDEPVDVVAYRTAHQAFPHESTANQWFTEAQFESYRVLGRHSVDAALNDPAPNGLGVLAERLRVKAGARPVAAS